MYLEIKFSEWFLSIRIQYSFKSDRAESIDSIEYWLSNLLGPSLLL